MFRAKLISHLSRQVTPYFTCSHIGWRNSKRHTRQKIHTPCVLYIFSVTVRSTRPNGELDVLNVRSVCMYKVYTIYMPFLLYYIIWVHNFCTFSPLQYVQHVQMESWTCWTYEVCVCTKSILFTSNFSCITSYGFIISVHFLRYSTFNTSKWRLGRVERTKCVYVQSLYYLHALSLVLHDIPFWSSHYLIQQDAKRTP